MGRKKRVLLKLTGKIVESPDRKGLSSKNLNFIIKQIKELKKNHQLGIVIGGGNIFRGDEQGAALGLSASVGHHAGMVATIVNGLVLKDLLEQQAIETSLLSAIVSPQICDTISQSNIDSALKNDKVIIFAGGTGVPFFTTDTNAIVRGLQIGAQEIWKCTGVDGIYTADPQKDKEATLIKKIKYSDAISQKLGIMDTTAVALAQKHGIIIRVFNIFEENSLIKAAKDQSFGSTIN